MEKEEARQEAMYGPPRLWLKPGTSADVVVLDDNPVCIYEHNPKIGGSYKNWITCLQGVHDDVVCCQKLGPDMRYYAGYMTIVDCSKWTDGKGKTHQYDLKLCSGKMKTLKRWRRKREELGHLAGAMFRATREDDRSPNVGDEWAFQKDADLAKLFGVAQYKGQRLVDMWDEAERDAKKMAKVTRLFAVKPDADGRLPRHTVPLFNYYEVLKPKDPADLRVLLAGAQKDDGGYKGKTGGSEEDVPF
mgnify:CR=1 FL=1